MHTQRFLDSIAKTICTDHYLLGGRAASYLALLHYIQWDIKTIDTFIAARCSDLDIYFVNDSKYKKNTRNYSFTPPIQVIYKNPASKYLVNNVAFCSSDEHIKATINNYQSDKVWSIKKDPEAFAQHILSSYDLNVCSVGIEYCQSVVKIHTTDEFLSFKETKILSLTNRQRAWFYEYFNCTKGKHILAKHLTIVASRFMKYSRHDFVDSLNADDVTLINLVILDILNTKLLEIVSSDAEPADSSCVYGKYNLTKELIQFFSEHSKK